MAETQTRSWQLAGHTRALFLNAMALFTITVLIGILNGLDLVEFSHNQLLTHVHAGTLGWITLSVFGASLWLSLRTAFCPTVSYAGRRPRRCWPRF